MEFFDGFLSWFNQADWAEIMGAVAFFVLAFDRLAKLTPTTKDDVVLAWIYKIFAILGVKVPELTRDSAGHIVAEK